MKLVYLSLSVICLIYVGCSTTYNLADVSSNEELVKEYNNSTQSKKVEVTLHNDSLLTVPEGTEIKNGNMLLKYSPDYYPSKINRDVMVPLTEVKQASYKNHWKSMAPGIYSGFTVGGIVGATGSIFKYETGGNPPVKDTARNFFMGALSGAILGGIVGYIIGWDNIYQFH